MQNAERPPEEWNLNEMLAWLTARFSQAEIAQETGLDQSTISRIARGDYDTKYSNGKGIERFFLKMYAMAQKLKVAA
ncbi:MAG: helix-turn-helix domain-containing protein [Casimicrobium sp.]